MDLQKLLERYNKCIAAGGDYFEGDLSSMCVVAIKVPKRKSLKTYLMILVNSNFYDYLYYSSTFIEIQPNLDEQEKKRQRIYDLLNAETKLTFLCLPYTKQRKNNF